MSKGFLITFEGIDGVGKTTQLNKLKTWFEDSGAEIVLAKEPGDKVLRPGFIETYDYVGSNIGAQIRHMLFKDPTTHKLAPGVNDVLFLADHMQLQWEVIQPALEQGKVVLCDRYDDSEFAYAHGKKAGGKPVQPWVLEAFRKSTSIEPHATVLLTGSPERLVTRTKRGGHEEGKQAGKVWADWKIQEEIQNAYLLRLAALPRTITVTDVHLKGVDQVFEELVTKLGKRLEYLTSTPAQQMEFSNG